MFHEMQVVDDEGKIHLEKVQDAYGDDEEMHKILLGMGKRCLYPKGETQCDRAYWLNKCWKTADPVVRIQRIYFYYDVECLIGMFSFFYYFLLELLFTLK